MLVGGLVAAVVVALVGARLVGRCGPAGPAERDARGRRPAGRPVGHGGPPRRPLLLAAEAFRLADTPATRRGLTTALDGHERVERAASFAGTPQDPVLSGGGQLTFGIGNSVVGWPIGAVGRAARAHALPGAWGAWLVAAPSPVDDVVLRRRGGPRRGPWLRTVSTLDGTSRLLLRG